MLYVERVYIIYYSLHKQLFRSLGTYLSSTYIFVVSINTFTSDFPTPFSISKVFYFTVKRAEINQPLSKTITKTLRKRKGSVPISYIIKHNKSRWSCKRSACQMMNVFLYIYLGCVGRIGRLHMARIQNIASCFRVFDKLNYLL